MKCKDCKHLIKTREAHNGNMNEILEYNHCDKIFKDEYEMENVVECEGYEKI